MPGNPGEKIAQDRNRKPVDAGLDYADPNHRTAEVVNRRMTSEGFAIDGHAARAQAPVFLAAIRDTSTHSDEIDISEYVRKLITLENTLDQSVRVYIRGRWASGEADHPLVTHNLAAGGTYEYETLEDPWPILYIEAKCSVAPTTGVIQIRVVKQT